MRGTTRQTTRSTLAVRIGVAALVVVAAASSIAPATAAPSREDVLRAKAELDRLNQRVELLVEQFNQARLELAQIRSELADIRAEADRARADADRAIAELNRNAALAYQGLGSQWAALLGAGSIAELSDRLEFIGSMAQADADLATEAARAEQRARWSAEALQEALARQQAIVDRIRAKEAEIRQAAADARAYYEDLNRRYQDYLARLEAQQEAAAAQAATEAAGQTAPASADEPPSPPPAPNPNVQAVLDAAYSVLGVPYQWGGASPETGFDCSGFTMWAWAHAGVSLPHSSQAQYDVLPHVSREDLQPGDLLFFYTPISHVAIYLGGGSMIHSPHTGSSVSIAPVYWQYFVGAARPG